MIDRRAWGLLAVVVPLLVLVACGGGQTRFNLFSTDWEDDRGASIDRVWRRVHGVAIQPSVDLAVGVAGHGDKLVALRLGRAEGARGGGVWTFGHPIDSRPVIAGQVVVASGGGELFALDGASGQVIWRRPTGGLAMVGAGDDGTATVVALRRAGGAGTTLLAVTHDGQVVRQIETSKLLGAPAVLDGMAFVPWSGQYVSVIDLSNGDEAARVTLREETSRAWAENGSLWFGDTGFIRFDARIRDASKGEPSRVVLPKRALPGLPKLARDPGVVPPLVANADDRVHLYARPEGGDAGAAIADDCWYGTYFRVAMGFGASDGKLVWAHLHPSAFIGGAVGEGSLTLCDDDGRVTVFDAKTGGVLSEGYVGEPLQACVVSADGLRQAGPPKEDIEPLTAQLAAVVLADAPELVSVQRFLLQDLAAQPDDRATKALVDLTSDPRTSPELLADARLGLAGRRNGEAFLEAALARHYDYLKDVLRAPPVGPIAEALGAMKAKRSASLLAGHLFDPADTDDDVRQAAAALAVVAGPSEAPAMRRFFGMYRASAGTDDIAAAVASVGEGLLTLDDAKGRSLVLAAAHDRATVPYARERLQALTSAQPPQLPAPSADAGASSSASSTK